MMKSNIEKAVDFIEAVENKDWFTAGETLDDEFKFFGPLPDPFNKKEWISFQQAIFSAFPDFNFNVEKVESDGDSVFVTLHMTGTHTHSFDFPLKGIRSLPPTQTQINLPLEKTLIKFRDGKILEIRSDQNFHAGLAGIFEQLGLE